MSLVICLTGVAGSGKDTAANTVKAIFDGIEQFKWADTLKDVVTLVYGWDRARLDDDLDYKEEKPLNRDGSYQCPGEHGNGLTRREVLQILGTDCFREKIADDTWVRAAARRVEEIEQFAQEQEQARPDIYAPGSLMPKVWINTDTRFLNEAEFAQENMDAVIIRVEREGATQGTASTAHRSETEMAQIVPDYVITAKDGDLPGLRSSITELVGQILGE